MRNNKIKILITTGIYPPKIGGPAQYAKNLKNVFEKKDCIVDVKTFNIESYLPSGVRHIFFFFKIIPKIIQSDFVIVLDTFSVGVPTILASKIFNKKTIIRTGGDFLWEQYVERTGKKVLFKNFYKDEIINFSFKEKIIFSLSKWVFSSASQVVFSTEWQRDIFYSPYELKNKKINIIENYYGEKEDKVDISTDDKTFVASTRDLKWKNLDILKSVFNKIYLKNDTKINLITSTEEFDNFIQKIKRCYAVILVSLGDISPNMILDAIRNNKPFICTKEVGIYEKIKDAGIFVDPLDEKQIENAVLELLDLNNYEKAKQKVESFNFLHSWENIADEFLRIYKNSK